VSQEGNDGYEEETSSQSGTLNVVPVIGKLRDVPDKMKTGRLDRCDTIRMSVT
jgi:hypothetical protein